MTDTFGHIGIVRSLRAIALLIAGKERKDVAHALSLTSKQLSKIIDHASEAGLLDAIAAFSNKNLIM